MGAPLCIAKTGSGDHEREIIADWGDVSLATNTRNAPDQIIEALKQEALQGALQPNLDRLHQLFKDCSDVVGHQFAPNKEIRCCMLFIDGLVQKDLIARDIIAPMLQTNVSSDVRQLLEEITPMGDAKVITTMGDVVLQVLSGDAVLLVDGATEAISYGVRHWEARSVSEPSTETVIRGPHEGFVETLRFNTVLIRRKIRSPKLKMVHRTIGTLTQTSVVVSYIEGVATPGVVQEVLDRLERIELDSIDGILESGYIEELIEDSSFSPFPQAQYTERPDVVAANLLEGRVAILVDGTPFVLIVPAVFAQFMQASEDYYIRFMMSSAIRALRYVFLFVALLLPSLYVAIVTFHQEMLPTNLLLSVAASREGVPFPAFVEAMMMEITFEILRESGIRLPKTIGQAVSIVGALVIGESAVRAGLVSAPLVIVVSVTGISSFAIPRYNAAIAIRMLRFPLIFLAGFLGLFGIVAGLCGILIHLCSLRSFGVPYLTPLAPLNWQVLRDVFIRAPHWWRRQRPRLVGQLNPIRSGKDLKPSPPPWRAP